MGNELSSLDTRPQFDDSVSPQTLSKRTVSAVADYIRSGHVNKVVFMVGAGISTSAGVPDFRSPNTGLYANLAKFDLPHPEAIFDIGYFQQNPLPFFTLAKDLYPGEIRPTIAHSFMKLLCDKGLVSQIFTQNIDCLERVAGIPPHLITEAHGSFASHSCTECGSDYPDELMKENIQKLEIPHCITPQCNGVVKPDIVFFGESLPVRFFREVPKVQEADLVIIMGTSLQVMPFAALPQRAKEETPRVLINREKVGGIGSRKDDILMLESCDIGVRRLAKCLGWLDELEELWAKTNPDKKLDKGKNRQSLYDGPMDMDEVLRAQVEVLTRDVEKNLKLADRHRQSVSHQLSVDAERRNTIPLIRNTSQLERRDSSPISPNPGAQLDAGAKMAPIALTEVTNSAATTIKGNGDEKGEGKATENTIPEIVKEPVSNKTTHGEAASPTNSGNL